MEEEVDGVLCVLLVTLSHRQCVLSASVPILAIWRHHHRHQLQQQLGDKLYRRHCAAVVSANQFTTNFTSGTFLSVSLSPFLPFYLFTVHLFFSCFLYFCLLFLSSFFPSSFCPPVPHHLLSIPSIQLLTLLTSLQAVFSFL